MCRQFILIAVLMALSACTLQPVVKPAQISDWQDFVDHQTLLTQWRIQAKLGYRAPGDSGSALLEWHQNQHHFDVHLSGPFGAYATRISGDPEHVILQRGDEQHFATSSADLTRQLLGLPLPVEALTWWVRGIPTPDQPVDKRTHSDTGTLSFLSQAGWDLEFSRYENINGWLLPGKISGQQGDLSFKLIINKWTI